VLVGGLGMGFTLRSTLDLLPKNFEGRDRAAPHANHYQEAPRAALKNVSNVRPECFSGTAADGRLDETYRVANHHSRIGTRAVAGQPPVRRHERDTRWLDRTERANSARPLR
jgi:hypothetical protein